ncbi:small ribosomal subunit protein eS10-like isoform X2 [Montipora capricornis]
MLIPKKNRVLIYEHLFKDGVAVARKDFKAQKHPEIEGVPNLQVIKAMQSLKTRGYVQEQFSWHHFYWYLTNDGITYLRDFLHLPPEIVPATLRRQARTETARPRPKGPDQPRGPPTGEPSDREAYRRGEPKGGAPSDFRPDFRGGADVGPPAGFGRGRGGRGGFGAPPPQ